MKMSMVVAMDEDCFIGKGSSLPWRLAADMVRFRLLTEGDGINAVIMGRETWDSLPDNFRPLPNRLNIVMTRNTNWESEGAEIAHSPEIAVEIAENEGCEGCWIIGGAQIYDIFLDRVEEIHVTKVHVKASGDVLFPNCNRPEWNEEIIECLDGDNDNEHPTSYSIWTRRDPGTENV
jgi:dihydrofolate reductase